MNHKKNLATALAVLMAVQNSGQPWSVFAYDEDSAPEPVTEKSDGTGVEELSDDPVIDEAEDEVVPAPEDEVPAFEDMSTEGTYTVNINITNKDVNIDPVKLDLGVVAEKISLEGYSFSNAMVNGKEVKAVRTWEDEKYVQYADGSVDKLTDTITVNMEAKEEEENVPAKAPVEEKAPEAPVNEEKAPEPETTYYEVKFFDQIVVDGTLQKAETPITTQWIKDGELAVAPGTVCPEGYAFTGWSGDVNSPITKNTEFVAQYAKNEAPIKLTINYVFEGSEMVAAQPWVASVKMATSSMKSLSLSLKVARQQLMEKRSPATHSIIPTKTLLSQLFIKGKRPAIQ